MTAWRESAACLGMDTAIFYAEAQMGRGDSKNRTDVYAYARSVCARCPVKAECLEWALGRKEWGFWGGKSPGEREAEKRKRQRARKVSA